MKKAFATIIGAALLALVPSTIRADESGLMTTQIMGSVTVTNLGVDIMPIPTGYVPIQRWFRVAATNAASIGIRIDERRQTNQVQGVLISSSEGWIMEARPPATDVSTTYGVSTGGTTVVDYWLKLRN